MVLVMRVLDAKKMQKELRSPRHHMNEVSAAVNRSQLRLMGNNVVLHMVGNDAIRAAADSRRMKHLN
jgi:hypothetical protein